VVGAGIAGLACARALADAGRPVLVLDRAAAVGGRCATRAFEGQPIDFGVGFLHGRDPDFLAAVDEVPGARIPGWPRVIQGAGRPSEPQAFSPGERRIAFAEGVYLLPRHLARGLDVHLGVRVVSFGVEGRFVRLDADDREPVRARTVVVAIAAEQALRLLAASPATGPSIGAARAILGMVRSRPCLTVMAGYPLDGPAPAFHVWYPEGSRVLELVVHDSSKRPAPSYHALVYQAHARWSSEHSAGDGWAHRVLDEAGTLLGSWAAAPSFFQAHSWRYARTDRSAELCEPLLLDLPGGARLGLAGELFAPGGGVEAAWISGRRLARRILAEDAS
jgi:predicted NAD/FAD-dependent oxidoreductase